jgi:hypothetical protein
LSIIYFSWTVSFTPSTFQTLVVDRLFFSTVGQSLSISHSVCSKTRIQSTSRSCFGVAVGVALGGKLNTHDANMVTFDNLKYSVNIKLNLHIGSIFFSIVIKYLILHFKIND